jgi:hypothetical protein
LKTPLGLKIQDLYLGASRDVELSSGDDDVSTLDALATKQKQSAGDDAEDGRASSIELIAPNPISSNTLG